MTYAGHLVTTKGLRWAGHVARMEETRAYIIIKSEHLKDKEEDDSIALD
jgi:hypothetical protein